MKTDTMQISFRSYVYWHICPKSGNMIEWIKQVHDINKHARTYKEEWKNKETDGS